MLQNKRNCVRFCSVLLFAVSVTSMAAQTAKNAAYRDKIADILEAKTYPLLSFLENNTTASRELQANATWRELKHTREAALAEALKCKTNACYTAAFKFTADEVQKAGEALAISYEKNASFRAAIAPLLKAGVYRDGITVRDAWTNDTNGVNSTISQYGEGAVTPYPKIDAMDFPADSKELQFLLRNATIVVRDEQRDGDLFFADSARFASSLLRINDREDAAHFEPMERGMNAAAIAKIRTTIWSRYPYSAILVPGIGPEKDGEAISPLGRLHVALAVERYRQGKAPFLIVSGGSVHPAHTHFVEAVEMRRELMTRYGVPESAILIDPHARHTTTNLRNAVREIFHYGMPTAKPVLIVCNEAQAKSIASSKFVERNQRELHYLPWLTLKQLSPNDVEFTPNKESLLVDSLSPLDP